MEMEELLAKYFTGEISKDERLFVEKWRSQSEDHAKTFFETKKIWLESLEDKESTRSFFQEEFAEETSQGPRGIQLWLVASQWPKYVAAAMLVLAIGLLFVLNNSSSNDLETLADGSEIRLHKDASFDVVSFDEDSREVRVDGKAYFDIERDESRPFIIHTKNAQVVVLGTSFVVDTDEIKTEVSVESGVVELVNNASVSIKLEKGDLGIASDLNEGIIKKPNENENYLAWKTRLIIFKGASMMEVATILEDVYDVKVEFDNSDFGNCKLTARIQKKSLDEALEIIARTFEIDYQLKKGKVIFKGKGC